MTFFTHSSHMFHDIKCTMQSGGSKNIDLLTDSPEPLAAAGSAWQTSLRSPQHGTGACMCVSVRVYVDVCMHACVSSGIGAPMFRYMYGTGLIAQYRPHSASSASPSPVRTPNRRTRVSSAGTPPHVNGVGRGARDALGYRAVVRALRMTNSQQRSSQNSGNNPGTTGSVLDGWLVSGVGGRYLGMLPSAARACVPAYIHACMQIYMHICMHPHTHAYSYTCPMQRTSDAEWCDGAPVTS